MKTIQIWWTRRAGHSWRSKDKFISDVLFWTPSYGHAKVGWPARTYLQQLCADMGCSLEDLPGAMDNRDEWWERVREIHASSMTWWWWWWLLLKSGFWNLKDQGLTSQIKWKIVRKSSTMNSFNGWCNLCIDEKFSKIYFKDCRLLLNEPDELVFKCKHKSQFKLSWLEATEAPTLDKNKDIDFGWFLLEISLLFQ